MIEKKDVNLVIFQILKTRGLLWVLHIILVGIGILVFLGLTGQFHHVFNLLQCFIVNHGGLCAGQPAKP